VKLLPSAFKLLLFAQLVLEKASIDMFAIVTLEVFGRPVRAGRRHLHPFLRIVLQKEIPVEFSLSHLLLGHAHIRMDPL
jgi:hypothetical protein